MHSAHRDAGTESIESYYTEYTAILCCDDVQFKTALQQFNSKISKIGINCQCTNAKFNLYPTIKYITVHV